MLSYQPAFDPYNTIFRLLRLLPILQKDTPTDLEYIHILDFYLLFPYRIATIRFHKEDSFYKKLVKQYENLRPYGEQPDDWILFSRMKPIQSTAIETLVSCKIINHKQLAEGKFSPTNIPIATQLSDLIRQKNIEQSDLIKALKTLLNYELRGPDGLKARTSLMEFRYDIV